MKVFQNNQWIGSKDDTLSFSFNYYFSKSHRFGYFIREGYKHILLKTLNLR